jgi:hypothetical protein
MQANQAREQFPSVKQCIDQAARLCQTSNEVPDHVRDCIRQLNHEAETVAQVLDGEQNENRIRECIDHLEKTGDSAIDACASEELDERVENAVRQAHDAISEFKHRLH